MKTTKFNLKSAIIIFTLGISLHAFTRCSSDDDDNEDIAPKENCDDFECQNGGTAIEDIELENCRCLCPQGYSGEFCEVKD